jgi:hypothetical protein
MERRDTCIVEMRDGNRLVERVAREVGEVDGTENLLNLIHDSVPIRS